MTINYTTTSQSVSLSSSGSVLFSSSLSMSWSPFPVPVDFSYSYSPSPLSTFALRKSPTPNATYTSVITSYDSSNKMSNSTSSSLPTEVSTTTALLGSVLAILMAGVGLMATRYIPSKWLDLIKSRFGSIQNFTSDPIGSIRSTVQNVINDPGKVMKQISQAMSTDENAEQAKGNEPERPETDNSKQVTRETLEKSKMEESEKSESAKAEAIEAVIPDEEIVVLPGQTEDSVEKPQMQEHEGVVKTLYNWFMPRT